MNNKKKKDTAKKKIEFTPKQLQKIEKLINNIEVFCSKLKNIIADKGDQNEEIYKIDTKSAKVYIEGKFNGKFMIDNNGKKHLVPENYASKSKLVSGDRLKLVVAQDGTYVYKQIAPILRERKIGILHKMGDSYQIKTEDKPYNVLKASVTYFKAKSGDKLTIIIPKDQDSGWAAIENKII